MVVKRTIKTRDGKIISFDPNSQDTTVKEGGVVGEMLEIKYYDQNSQTTRREYIDKRNIESDVSCNVICFIATVVYGNENATEVQVLRNFRDNELNQSLLGRKFVRAYYSGLGKMASEALKKHHSLIPIVKTGLDILVEKYSNK